MLELELPAIEWFDDELQEFRYGSSTVLRLEHSLVSISKWEAKWKKPFLSKDAKTPEETLDYIKCMTMNQNVNPEVYNRLGPAEIKQIDEYIQDNRTATTFTNSHDHSRRIVTSELVYFWMAQYNIPMDCQKWHFSRLMTLLRIASIENSPKKKMSSRAILSQNKALNAARRKAMNTKG